MPTPPKPNETRAAFIARCAKYMHDSEGMKGEKRAQGLARCYSMWRRRGKVRKKAQARSK
uniref:Uncharacterized protein n=1 Tax=viral metagenome TaxID=1070528 RepID=A0A6M3INI6_9ZZZZ